LEQLLFCLRGSAEDRAQQTLDGGSFIVHSLMQKLDGLDQGFYDIQIRLFQLIL
jgi:hypothetical protein